MDDDLIKGGQTRRMKMSEYYAIYCLRTSADGTNWERVGSKTAFSAQDAMTQFRITHDHFRNWQIKAIPLSVSGVKLVEMLATV